MIVPEALRNRMSAQAVGVLLIIILSLALWGIGAFSTTQRAQPNSFQPETKEGDKILFIAVVERLRQGQPYYTVMGEELQAKGFPAAEIPNWRTPLHLTFLSRVTVQGGTLILFVIVLAGLWLMTRMRQLEIPMLIFVGIPLIGLAAATIFSEAWAGALIALSLASYFQQRWTLAAVYGVLALFMRELAVVYAVVCGLLALWSRRKTESLIWIVGALLYTGYFVWHAQHVRAAIPPGAMGHAQSWVRWGGLPFLFATLRWYGWTQFASAPLIVAAGLLGTASRQMPMQARMSLLAYVVAFLIVGQPFNSYWGLLVVPLWGVALPYAIDGATRLLSATEPSEQSLLPAK